MPFDNTGDVLKSIQRLGIKSLVVLASFGMIVIDAILWLSLPGRNRNSGFSGVLKTLFVALLCELFRNIADSMNHALAIGGLGKIAIESRSAGAVLPLSNLPSVTEAHFAGFVAGLVLRALTAAGARRGGVPP